MFYNRIFYILFFVLTLFSTAVYLLGGRPLIFGSAVLFGLAILCLILGICQILPVNLSRLVYKLLVITLIVIGLFYTGLEGFIYANSNSDINGEPNVMIILGANLWGGEPSPILTNRLDKAIEYLEKNPNMTIIVTGGMGDDEPVSEAYCMANYLAEAGIDERRIIQEDKATNTFENMEYSKAILDANNISSDNVLIVSSSSHLARAKLLAKRNGMTCSTLSAPISGDITYKLYFSLREGAALVKSFLFDR